MPIEWDELKRESNLAKHGVDLASAAAFAWNDALIWQDDRIDYRETRMTALGFIGNRLHVLVNVERAEGIRVISLRKANRREIRRYAEDQ